MHVKKSASSTCASNDCEKGYPTNAIAIVYNRDSVHDHHSSELKSVSDIAKKKIVMLDLETTSLADHVRLLSLQQHPYMGNSSMNMCLPNDSFSKKASEKTEITKQYNTRFIKGSPVSSNPICKVLTNFSVWLANLNKEILLVSHNSKAFDAINILRIINFLHLKPFLKIS